MATGDPCSQGTDAVSTQTDTPIVESKPVGSTRLAASLWAVFAVTFINSVATGIAYNGVFFITDKAFGFSRQENLLYGLMMGVTYIVGALGAGPGVRALRARFPSLTTRGVLIGVMFLATALYLLPVVAWFAISISAAPAASRGASQWAMWAFMACYSTLCGVLWPIVESFLSGGRTDHALRAATGKFNVCWSSALVVAMLIVSQAPGAIRALTGATDQTPGVAAHGLTTLDATVSTLAIGALLHLIAIFAITALPREPGAHVHETHSYPPSYPRLLAVHRALLPTSYMVMYVMLPLMPSLFKTVGINSTALASGLTATWLVSRIAMFFTLDRWHGWHGKWITAVGGTIGMLAGFTLCIASGSLGDSLGLAALITGLAIFGAGVAAIYCAALYYALEVGAAAVDAGGMHEALIGVGYTVGPALGLGALGLTPQAAPGSSAQVLSLVGLVALGSVAGISLAVTAGVRASSRLG